jgi:2-polyprenyl-6-methoxyphenol hydroxylase-like FAD-dependent oxidoreductase
VAVLSRYVPADLTGRRAVVVGAGIAGLATALALGERGADVVVVDGDPQNDAASPDEAFAAWSRRRVPQFRHSHAFLARLRNVLVRGHPEIYAELLAVGAAELRLLDFPPPALRPLAPEPGDADLAALGCRRTTFEWVLRRHVARRPWVRFEHDATVTGLVAEPGEPPAVRGVVVRRGGREQTLAADLVVDAGGRASKAADWLRAIGAAAPAEERSSSSVLYYTRFYRLLPGRTLPPPGEDPSMADFGWIKFAIFPGDSRTFSITFATPIALPRLKILADPRAFERMVTSLPGIAPFVAPDLSEPLAAGERAVLAMGGLENCRRRFVDREGRPLARGFFAIGDSAYHTNPLYGRGSTQAFLHAGLLGEALDATSGDVARSATRLDAAARLEIEPFYRASVLADLGAARKAERWRRLETGAAAPARSDRDSRRAASFVDRWSDSFFEDGVIVASRVDPLVFRAFVRMFNMIETPEEAFSSPEIIGRVAAVWLRGRSFRKRHMPSGPSPDAVLAACEAALRGPERVTA